MWSTESEPGALFYSFCAAAAAQEIQIQREAEAKTCSVWSRCKKKTLNWTFKSKCCSFTWDEWCSQTETLPVCFIDRCTGVRILRREMIFYSVSVINHTFPLNNNQSQESSEKPTVTGPSLLSQSSSCSHTLLNALLTAVHLNLNSDAFPESSQSKLDFL